MEVVGFLKDLGRAEYHSIIDDETLEGRIVVTLLLTLYMITYM